MTTPILKVGLVSGTCLTVSEIFLCLESPLRRSDALRLKAADGLKGFSSGIGFWGSPGWAIGGAIGLGLIEGLVSNSSAKAALQDLQEAARLASAAVSAGIFVPVKDIDGIGNPSPQSWRGIRRSADGTYQAYVHSAEPFVQANTLEAGLVCISFDKIETYIPPTAPALDDSTLANEYGVAFNGQQYEYGGYRYDRLADAIAYAKTLRAKA